ncbi:MAG: DUF192 domain-containing protein [Candidatus Limnocylindrales bacterium]
MGRRLLALGALAVLVVATTACAPRPVRSATIEGQRWELLVGNGDGMRGLDGFAGKDGMLFAYDREVDHRVAAWVMDGVALPLAIAWFDGDGRLVGTTTMPICPEEPCPLHQAPAPYRWAVEAPVGAFDALPSDATFALDGS